MIRTFSNETGSPEVKVRRESPVIAGAKVYPGTSISFTEAEWDVLAQTSKTYLENRVAEGSWSLSIGLPNKVKPQPIVQKDLVVAAGPKAIEKAAEKSTEEVAEEVTKDKAAEATEKTVDATEEPKSADEATGEGGAVEDTGEKDEDEDKATTEDLTKEDAKDEETTKENAESEKSEGVAEDTKSEKSEKPATETEDSFNYQEFLGQPITKIKEALLATDDYKSNEFIEKLIEAEKAGENRSSLIGWLTESLS